MIVDKNIGSYFEVLNIDTHDKFFRYAAYILIAFGVFVFLVGFCGCCGAIRGSKCLLGLVRMFREADREGLDFLTVYRIAYLYKNSINSS